MIVGIDNISPGASSGELALGGMHHFLRGLVAQLARDGAEHEFVVFSPTWADDLVSPRPANVQTVLCRGVPRSRLGRVLYEQLWLPGVIRRNDVKLWLGTVNVLPLAWGGLSILILQSLQYFTQPSSFSWTRRLYLRAFVPLSLRRADCVIAFSNASKQYIVRRFNLPESKVRVIYHGVRFREVAGAGPVGGSPAKGSAIEMANGDYILFVSAFYLYKNLDRLIQAFARLKPEYPHKLVLIGSETEYVTYESVRELARKHGLENDIAIRGHVPDSELPAYYQNASLMVMPSLEETFGLSVLEAMAFGCPVVTSNISSMREVGGEAVMLADPYSVESIAEAMARVLSDPGLSRKLAVAGQARAKEFTAERFTESMLEVINSLDEGRQYAEEDVEDVR